MTQRSAEKHLFRYCLDVRTATDHFPGIGRYVSSLARALAGLLRDDEQLILLINQDEQSRWQLPAAGEKIVHAPTAVSPFSLSQQWQIPRLLRQLQATCYHTPYYLMPYRPGVPTLLTVHDLIPQLFPELVSHRARLLFRLSTEFALRAANQIIAVSAATQGDFCRLYTIPEQQISVIPHAPDPRFQPPAPAAVAVLRERLPLPNSYLLYLGINKPHKNLLQLVRVWGRLREREPNFPALVIAGAWDDRYPEARDFAAANQLSGVHFLGPVADELLPALYGAALAFVFPSLYEGFGLPVLEAMACETAVLCANRSSLPEVVGPAALLFDPDMEAEFRDKLALIATDADLRRRLEKAAIIRATKFTWSRAADATLRLYRKISH